MSLIFSTGVTNTNSKWLFYYLNKLPKDYVSLEVKLLGLLGSPTQSENEMLEFICGSLMLIYEIFEKVISKKDMFFPQAWLDQVRSNLKKGFDTRNHNSHQITSDAFDVRSLPVFQCNRTLLEIVDVQRN